MKYTLTLILLLISSLVVLSQEAIKFEPGLISDDGIFGLTISPDGNHAFWVRSKGRRDSLVIMEAFKIKDKWQTPKLSKISKKGQSWREMFPLLVAEAKDSDESVLTIFPM